jgi:hypothetical protein
VTVKTSAGGPAQAVYGPDGRPGRWRTWMSGRVGIGTTAGLVVPVGTVKLAGAPWWAVTAVAFAALVVVLASQMIPQDSPDRLALWQPLIAWLVSAPRRRRRRPTRRASPMRGRWQR